MTNEQRAELRRILPGNIPAGVLDNVLSLISDSASPAETEKALTALLRCAIPAEKRENPVDSRKITRDYFDKLLLELRQMDEVLPSTEAAFFGHNFASPIMNTALSHLGTFNPDMPNGMVLYAQAAKQANVLHWVGMSKLPEFEEIMAVGAKTVRIVKPYADEKEIYSRLAQAEELGCVAVGMDIDHSTTRAGELDVVFGDAMDIKPAKKLREYMSATKLPFVIKGVLSVRDALRCAEAGASGIVVSHHNGRVDSCVPPVMVLPEIARAVGKDLTIFVDCGVSSGMDAYKAMALGAHGVCVGTHLIPQLKKGGAQAAADRLLRMNAELKGAMASTGVADVHSFDPSVIYRRDF